jgi:methionine-gamma-lyase
VLDVDALSRNARSSHNPFESERPSDSRLFGGSSKDRQGSLSRFLREGDARKTVFERQCLAPGSTFAFDVKGGQKEAFELLDNLQIMKLAVSLGGTETLVSHPASMTHSGVARELREEIGLTDALIRISIGIENVEDLLSDLAQALEHV